MPKIVINTDWGGFGLSEEAFENLLRRKGIEWETEEKKTFGISGKSYYRKGHLGDEKYYLSEYDFYQDRSDPDLVKVVEEMSSDADGNYASLKVVDVPDDVEWLIYEHDGVEVVHEKHRVWY
jgi:hypothetical protein